MPDTVTVLALPTFLSEKVDAVLLSVTASPEMMSADDPVTIALVVPS